jgi:hypothetical protein
MANKTFRLENGQLIKIYKRRQTKNIRLAITTSGQARVTIPVWAPYSIGLDFARKRQDWIKKHQFKKDLIYNGQLIGKCHHIYFEVSDKPRLTYSLNQNSIVIKYPFTLTIEDALVQAKANAVAIKALKNQAESLLTIRINELSKMHQITFEKLNIKQLKSRWGSCDSNKNITLNLYLMQLPWHLIDYVITHELVHTKVLRHGPLFWQEISKYDENYKNHKKELQSYNTFVA